MHSPVIDLTQALIACPSITPDDAGCQDILIDRLKKMNFTCEILSFGEVTNLWARRGTQAPLLVFAGHTDVVPTGPLDNWTSPPFQPTEHNGYLYGRGAADMKAAIAAMIVAVENFLKLNPNFPGSIGFLITSDEEGPSINGTKKVIETLQQRNIQIDYCIIGEPSSDKQVGDQIRVGRRGSLHGKLLVQGKQGHVAHPHLAINPIHQCMQALHVLTETEWDKGNQDFPPTTFQITNIHSGTGATNVIPGELEALFNFRFSTAVTIENLKQRTQDIFRQYQLQYAITWTVGAEPFLCKRGKLITATQLAIKTVTHLDVNLSTGGGTSDGRFIAPTGAEVIELGVCNATAHHIDENVKIDDLEKLVIIYQKILEELF